MEIRHRVPRLTDHVGMKGLVQITDVTSGSCRRCIWIVVLLAGISFTTFNIVNQVRYYISSPISVQVDYKTPRTLPFPTVTICNTNHLKKSFVESFNMTSIVKKAFKYNFQDTSYHMSKPNFSALAGIKDEVLPFLVSHTFDDCVIKCTWEQRACSEMQLVHTFTDMGLCFSFNTNGSLRSFNSGRPYGLHLYLNAQSDEFFRSRLYTEGPGFMIAVHAPEIPPVMNNIGIALQPGSQFFLGIEQQVVVAPTGLNGCGSQSLKYFKKPYSLEACRIECLADYVARRCSCRDDYMPNDAPLCSPEQVGVCLVPSINEYYGNGSECELSCPRRCASSLFSVDTMSSLVLTDEYFTAIGENTNKTTDFWKKNLVVVEIYFRSMSFVSVEKRNGYTVLDLFCDIGGAFGLILGASVITALEVIDFVLLRIYLYKFGRDRSTDEKIEGVTQIDDNP